MDKNQELKLLFYDPSKGLDSINKLYQKVKGKYTKKEVEEFIAAEAAMAKAELNKVEKVVETEVEAVKEAVKKVTRRKK